MSNKGLISIAALAAALVLFFALNIVSGKVFTGTRVDLTEGKLYTLSQGSKNITSHLQEPIKLTLYITEKTLTDYPPAKAFAPHVKEMLREYARASAGKIDLKIVDPEPFSEAEDKAVAAGIQALPTGHGEDVIYFGLIGENSTTGVETIPFMDPAKEEFLEYDIAKLINKLSDAAKKPIGLMTWLPIQGSEANPMMGGRGGSPEWQINKRLSESFDVRSISTNIKEIPADIKVLVIIHPKNMAEPTQYAVDQFVMRGGRVVLFVDPVCEADVPPGVNPMQAMQIPKNSDLPKLMGAWGIEMELGKIATDKDLAVPVSVSQTRREAVPYVAFLHLTEADRSSSDPVTGQLAQFMLGSAGVLKKKDGATTDVQPLLMTTKEAEEVDASLVSFVPDPKKMLADYKPGGKILWLAVRATGNAKSAFPDGPPKMDPTTPGDKNAAPATPLPHVAESQTPINVVVTADCDMLTDRFWINETRLGNIVLGTTEWTDNGAFTVSAVENLSGSNDLISLRARGKSSRPFTRIQQLETNAQQEYQQKEQDLKKKLTETEQQISELQKQRGDGKETRMVLTPEQQKKIDDFRAQMVQTRKELRDVKFNLDKDVRSLENKLMAVNIGAMPAIIAVFAIGLASFRASRRASDRQSASKG